MTAFEAPFRAGEVAQEQETENKPVKVRRPSRLALSNWPVRWKVFAIVLVPIALAGTFGGLRIYNSISEYRDLRLAADRAALVTPVENFMSGIDGVLLASSGAGDPPSALREFDARRSELQQRLTDTDVAATMRSGITTVINDGQALRDQVANNTVNVRQEVIEYAPMLLAAEDAISGSVQVAEETVRGKAQGLSRAVGHRGQMLMLQLLVNQGGQLPEPELRTSMITVAGTEPSTVLGLGQLLGAGSPDMVTLREQMIARMAMMGDPSTVLVDNPDLRQSLQASDRIVSKVINDTTASVIKAVDGKAAASRTAAIRDSAIVAGAFLVVLLLVVLVARSLVRPLRRLRAGALQVAHEDLAQEIEQVKAGREPPPIEPIPVHTSEEIGQVAHAVDELHEQALMMASEQAALQLQVADMFETLSRRNRSLVDQQLSLIDSLEHDEEDPDRLGSLFRLDHLAARMRRNGTNLLVLSGANLRREQAEPMPLVAVVNAAASEVEDYRRVTTATVPDSAIVGAAAADVIHLLAELIDNALRYSPPTSPVRVSAVRAGNGGLVIEVSDSGLGMTEADLRMANMRLKSGGEVTAYTARHMGLFVVGRLARQHGLVVRLRSSVAREPGSGTTAGVFVPVELITRIAVHRHTGPEHIVDAYAAPVTAGNGLAHPVEELAAEEFQTDPELFGQPYLNGSASTDVSGLPRRNPGASGITGAPQPDIDQPRQAPSDTSAFFGARANPAGNGAPIQPPPPKPQPEPQEPQSAKPFEHPQPASDLIGEAPSRHAAASQEEESPIFQRMMSDWLVDFNTMTEPPQDWKSVWDHGWAAAANAEEAEVHAHTDHGLPVRDPGARLVPGSPGARNGAHSKPDEGGVASGPGFGYGRHESGQDPAPLRDPDAVRASIGDHFGGVRAGRSHARDTDEGMETE